MEVWRRQIKELGQTFKDKKIKILGGAGCQQGICFIGVGGAFWGCMVLGVQSSERWSNCFFTMDKHENKLSFGGTGEIIGGAGRSSQENMNTGDDFHMAHISTLYQHV